MDSISPRDSYEDVLGFTKQTEVLLTGMGAKDLLRKFKQQNISTKVLATLSMEDLKLLGADSALADKMQKELVTIAKRISRSTVMPQQRLDQLSEVLVYSNKQLSLIHAFLTYARLRIKKNSIDSFIERDKNLRSSKALELAVEATIYEIQDAREALKELKLFLEDSSPSRRPTYYIATLGGVGLIALLILRKFT